MSRPPIKEVLKQAGLAVRSVMAQSATSLMHQWLEEHREELIAALIQANTARASELMCEFCRRFPNAAGFIDMAMGGSPETAIDAVGIYNPDLADELRRYQKNFEELQQHWRREQQNAPRS